MLLQGVAVAGVQGSGAPITARLIYKIDLRPGSFGGMRRSVLTVSSAKNPTTRVLSVMSSRWSPLFGLIHSYSINLFKERSVWKSDFVGLTAGELRTSLSYAVTWSKDR